MKKRLVSILCIAALMVACLGIGAAAAGGLEKIQAYLNRDIAIKLNGQTQTMYDVNGTRVYPISYNGTTYVPIRAVSNMLGIDVEWDSANYTVLLGETGTAKDFIEDFEPYAAYGFYRRTVADARPKTIAGKTYTSYLYFDSYSAKRSAYYDLGGKYDTLTLQAYQEHTDKNGSDDINVQFWGDNNTLLATCYVKRNALPETFTIDVSGVTQLTITSNCSELYMMNATIE